MGHVPEAGVDAPILGIDIGGTKLAVGLATPEGELRGELREPSRAHEGPDAMIVRVVELARRVMAQAGVAQTEVGAVGIACGGPLDPWRGVIVNALNNPGWVNIPLVSRIEAELGRPTFLDNDANAAALAEHRFGVGRGVSHMVYVTISTGIGGGLILDDRLYHGAGGNAGELGHLSVRADGGRRCHCGSIGCLEAYCSGASIAERFREALARGGSSVLAGTDAAHITAERVADAARAGDALASAVWNETTELLGAGIASIIHAFNPQLVVLGGGVTRAETLLFEPVRRTVRARGMPWLARDVRITPAQLGDVTGVLGAIAVALDRTNPAQARSGSWSRER